MVAHEKRNSAQLFCAVPTQNNLALSFLFFHRPTHTKVGIAATRAIGEICKDTPQALQWPRKLGMIETIRKEAVP